MSVRCTHRLSRAYAAAATALVLTACGGAEPTTSDSTTPSPTPSAWDLVALGDSMAAGYGVLPDQAYTRQYAALLGEELGVTVTVRDYATGQIRTVADWNDVLARDESLRSDLAEAEIVTVFVGGHNLGIAALSGKCAGDWPEPLKDCFSEATATMPADFDRLLATIRELVPDRASVMVGYNGGLPPPVFDEWSEEPYWPEMKRILVDRWRPGLYAAAEAHGAVVIGWYEALFGPAGEFLYPEFLQSDRLHFNAEGHRFLAELHAEQDGLGDE